MSPLPTQMRDRWQDRADTPPGKGTVYWHILMGGYPEVRSLAKSTQNQLASFTGLHMTPLNWLHISTLVVGNTDEIQTGKMRDLLECVSDSLASVEPMKITLGRVLYHPEAIMLGVDPSGALDPILDAARTATRTVVGRDGCTTSGPGSWVPHMTLCYSTAKQAAKPLIDALHFEVPACTVTIDKLTLVTQWGPERQWQWQVFDNASLGSH